ncbi:MAG: SCO family protein [Methylocystis sp.]|uniref:SCO family protein n=1 Tax=Methylocystis sp. TaxID=1911079 RepID=UPI003DA390F1
MPSLAKLPALLLLLLAPITSQDAAAQSAQLRQRQGALMPLDAALRDEAGQTVTLGALTERAPALLLFGYFHCRKLCTPLRNDVIAALEASGLRPGQDYSLLVVSLDPEEAPIDAANAKAESRARFPASRAGASWRFLTGSRDEISRIADAAGVESVADPRSDSFTHPVSVIVLTRHGEISNYLPGFGLEAAALRLALTKAGAGEIAKPASLVALLCLDLDPATGRYSLAVLKLLRLLAGGFALLGAGVCGRALFRERRT